MDRRSINEVTHKFLRLMRRIVSNGEISNAKVQQLQRLMTFYTDNLSGNNLEDLRNTVNDDLQQSNNTSIEHRHHYWYARVALHRIVKRAINEWLHDH